MFNGGCRKRELTSTPPSTTLSEQSHTISSSQKQSHSLSIAKTKKPKMEPAAIPVKHPAAAFDTPVSASHIQPFAFPVFPIASRVMPALAPGIRPTYHVNLPVLPDKPEITFSPMSANGVPDYMSVWAPPARPLYVYDPLWHSTIQSPAIVARPADATKSSTLASHSLSRYRSAGYAETGGGYDDEITYTSAFRRVGSWEDQIIRQCLYSEGKSI